MEKNVGGIDRIARLVLGPVLILVGAVGLYGVEGFALVGTLGIVLGALAILVGLVFTVTGATQKCVLHEVLGIDTYRGGESVETGTDDAKTGPTN